MTVRFRGLAKPSIFRRIASVMWRAPNNPNIYGSLDFDMTRSLAYLEQLNGQGQGKVTVTHLVVRAVARALAKHPELNGKVWGSKVVLRDQVDMFCQVASDGGRDLSGAKLENADRMSLFEIGGSIRGQAKSIRAGKDPTYKSSRNLFKILPGWLIRPLLWFSSFLSNSLHLHLPSMGLPRDPFGSAMVTSVGMFGIESGFAPFPPIARCPMVLVVTAVKDRPWVEDGALVVRPVLRLCATFDHRIIDGFHAAQISDTVSEYMRDPAAIDAAEFAGQAAQAAATSATEAGGTAPPPS